MKFHPEGMASLVAAILAPGDIERYGSYDRAADVRREQVLVYANQYYKINNCDFDNSAEQRTRGVQNLAKLNRANLVAS